MKENLDPSTLADITKAQERLGYAPSTGIVDGLRAQLAWQLNA